MKKTYTLLAFLFFGATLSANNFEDYKNHIAADRLLIIFENNISTTDQDQIIKGSGLVTGFVHLPVPRLTICYTNHLEAAESFFTTHPGVKFVSFFITDGNDHYAGVLNDFFVKLTDKSFEAELQKKLRAADLGPAVKDAYIPNLYKVVNSQYKTRNTVDLCASLQQESWIEYASPNYLLNPLVTSSDPLYNHEWYIHNIGGSLQSNGTPGADMRVDSAWTVTTGSPNIKVGLIDSGTDTLHADLRANLLPGHDALGDSTNGAPTPHYPEDGHGTCTAGLIVAVKDNSIGTAGVAPSCKVIPIHAFYYVNAGSSPLPYSTAAAFADAIGWAWDSAGADILSNSWGLPAALISFLPGGTQPVTDAVILAHNNGRNGKGTALFFSSGNDNDSTGPIWPGNLAQSISVNATNQCDSRKSPTDCSHDAWGGDFGTGLDFSAPGENTATSDMRGTLGFATGDYCLDFSGTSASCPLAAAVGALVLSVNPQLGAEAVRNIIAQTCDKVGGYGYDSVFANGSWCRELGHGRINAYRAVKLASTYNSINKVEEENKLEIYPNPANNELNIVYNGNGTGVVKVYDVTGKLVTEKEVVQGLNKADISSLSQGIYLVKFEDHLSGSTRKLVVYR